MTPAPPPARDPGPDPTRVPGPVPTPVPTLVPTPGRGLRRRLQRAVDALDLAPGGHDPAPVTEADLEPLPEPARRWLRASGVVGRPRVSSFRVQFRGRFRLGPDKPWLRAESWQYTSAVAPARVYALRLDLGPVPLFGLDTYASGRGRMIGRIGGLVKVVDGSGPELDLGELTTYLDDAVMLAPSTLLVPAVTWGAVDDTSFDVTITDAGLTSCGRVTLDEHDEAVDFVSSDRYADLPGGMVRAAWSTPRTVWVDPAGRTFSAGGRAVWHLPDGEYEYARGAFVPESLVTDLPPDRAAAAVRAGRS